MKSNTDLRRLIISLMGCSDEFWYRYTLKKDLYFKRLYHHEKEDIIKKSIKTSEEIKTQIISRYGNLNPVEYTDIYNLKLEKAEDDVINEYLYMALYNSNSKKITLNEGVIELIDEFIMKNELQDIIQIEEIENVALMHEIFHHIEGQFPEIYTRSKMLDRKVLNIFPYKKGINGSSEIGAIHFSKLMRGLSYSPCIYEILILLLTKNDSIVYNLFNDYRKEENYGSIK